MIAVAHIELRFGIAVGSGLEETVEIIGGVLCRGSAAPDEQHQRSQ